MLCTRISTDSIITRTLFINTNLQTPSFNNYDNYQLLKKLLSYYKRENTKNIEKNSNNNRKIIAKVLSADTLSFVFSYFLVCFLFMTSFFQKSWEISQNIS